MSCPHRQRSLVRVLHDRGEHVAEVCEDCGENARGPGKWVPRSSLPFGTVAAELPVWRDLRTPEGRGEQGTLF